jgi:ABC-type antimicrobial peptide transport system permease subunit
MTRRQLWVMLQLESAQVALAGAGAGSLLGLTIGVAAAWALERGGLSEVVVPLPTLLALVAGVVAAAAAGTALPAHRAGRLASAVASGLAE